VSQEFREQDEYKLTNNTNLVKFFRRTRERQ